MIRYQSTAALRAILFSFAFFFCGMISAQNLQEVVYLKNGSIIRGIIIEQIPEKSLKIQTADGSIFAYDMKEVQKITKEPPVGKTRSARTSTASTSFGSTFANINNGSGATEGYKGFVDFGYCLGTGDFKEDRIELSTAHGVQLNPNFFVGGGVAVSYLFDSEVLACPIFVDGRANLFDNSISPFFDFRIGYSVYDVQGFYLNPSFGCRFALKGSGAVHVGIGYSLQKGKNDWDDTISKKAISLKIGYEF